MNSPGDDPAFTEQIRVLEAEVSNWNEVLSRIDPASPTAPTAFENARVARGLARIRLEELQARARGDAGRSIDSYLDTDQENLERTNQQMFIA